MAHQASDPRFTHADADGSSPRVVYYTGGSMRPTFQDLDRLHVVSYGGRKIACGDVVVFVPPGEKRKVIHRVIAEGPAGIRTRGDNNSAPDEWTLTPDDIIGRVAWAERRGRRIRVREGWQGALYARVVHASRSLAFCVRRLLWPGYHTLAQVGLFRRWRFVQRRFRVVAVHRPVGTELHLLWGRRVIGRRPAGARRWCIRAPFRLVIDEGTLAEPVPSGSAVGDSEPPDHR